MFTCYKYVPYLTSWKGRYDILHPTGRYKFLSRTYGTYIQYLRTILMYCVTYCTYVFDVCKLGVARLVANQITPIEVLRWKSST